MIDGGSAVELVDVVVAAVLVDVLSVEVLSVDCVAVVVVFEGVDVLSLGGGTVVSVAVDVLSVEPPSRRVMPSAPDARAPAPSNAANTKTTPAPFSTFRRFMSSAPFLPPKIRRMRKDPSR
jgi:hypothetical protein